jgi:hypothetical protein
MDANTHIDLLFSTINSLGDSLSGLQSTISDLHSQINLHDVSNDNQQIDANTASKLETIKSNISQRSTHVENLISTALDPNQIQKKIEMINMIQGRINYYKNLNNGDN